jgi:peptidyl-prolyl cis-trans isomerase D
MGIFERIRQASPWVLTTFAVVFVGFMVLGDMNFDSIASSNSNPAKRPVAVVNEIPITTQEFEYFVSQQTANMRAQNAQTGNNQEIDETNIRRSIFTSLVDSKLRESIASQMGALFTDKVVGDYTLAYPNQYAQQAFSSTMGFQKDVYVQVATDPEGFFRKQGVPQEELSKSVAEVRELLIKIEEFSKPQMVANVVNSTLQQASGIGSSEYYKQKYIGENSYADFDMVYLKLSSVTDEDIDFNEEGLKNFYQENRSGFEQDAQRKLQYVSFELKPSAKDSTIAAEKLQRVANLFSKAKTKEDADKVFENMYYEYNGTTSDFVTFENLDRFQRSYLQDAVEGEIVGPAVTLDGTSYYHVAKLDSAAVDSVKAAHILININNNKDSALAVAKDIYNRATAGEDFTKLAADYSKDKSNASKGGDLGYFGAGRMIKAFQDAAFNAEVGEITEPVETGYGYHIIKVDDKVIKTKYEVKTINIKPSVSSLTKKQLNLKARDLANEAKNGGDLAEIAQKYDAQVKETASFFKGQSPLGSGYLGDFAFNEEKGSITDPVNLNNFGITVARVSEVIPKGLPNLDLVRQEVEYIYKNKLKKDVLKERAQKIYDKVSQSGDFQDAKDIDKNAIVNKVTNTKNNGFISGVQGRENVVTSAAHNMQVNEISKPIRGNTGYFIVRTLSKTPTPQELIDKNLAEYIKTEMKKAERSASFGWIQAIKKSADIEDKRYGTTTNY